MRYEKRENTIYVWENMKSTVESSLLSLSQYTFHSKHGRGGRGGGGGVMITGEMPFDVQRNTRESQRLSEYETKPLLFVALDLNYA